MWIDDNDVGREEITVRSFDTERTYTATLPFIFAVCQEAAGEHATLRGMDIRDLNAKEHCTWIVSRTKIEFFRMPVWRDTISVKTMPMEGWHLFCPRSVEGTDKATGEKLFSAMTHWIVMDTDKKRPVRPNVIADRLVIPEEAKSLSPDIGRICRFDDQETVETLPEYVPETNWFHTDYNHHINNVVYTNWICLALPRGILDGYTVREIDVQWEAQTYEGDDIYIESKVTGRDGKKVSFAQRIMRNEEDGKKTVLFEANSTWEEK